MPNQAKTVQQILSETLKVKFQKTSPRAKLPEKAYAGDAGWDVYSAKRVNIPGNGATRTIPVGFKMAIPDGYFAKIEGRGGFHANSTLFHKGTPIDSGYRGEVFAIVSNAGPYPVTIEAGQKFGQLVYYKVLPVEIEEVEEIPVDTERGTSKLGQSDNK
jgi:dUTP pyrophosphatase